MSVLLANTSSEGLTPLGSAPQRSWELVTGTVHDALGERHAALFAEPEGTAYGDRFDWYSSVSGTPKLLEDLEEEDRGAAEAILGKLVGDVQALADKLTDDKDPDKQRLGEALSNAINYPGAGSVYIFGSGETLQPVLVNWAWVADTQVAATGTLSGAGGRTAAAKAVAAEAVTASAPVPPPPPMRTRAGGPLNLWWLLWLGWLLLALMIGAILYLMIEACALRIPGVPNYCPHPGPTVSELERDANILRDQIAAVERRIGIADRACQPQQAAAAPPPEEDDFDRRLADAGAQRGDLTFSLFWEGHDDVDLHVTCPAGQTLFYRNRNACSGKLDVDSNAARASSTTTPVENVFFNGPGGGAYKIKVNLYKSRSGNRPRDFQLRIFDHGQTETLTGSVAPGSRTWTHTYQMRGQQ